MVSVTSAFSAAQTATSSQPNYKVYALLRNMASRSEGATATASSYFDASAGGSWPAWGAIDDDPTHINAGSVSVADNGIGQGTWKSASLMTTTTIASYTAWGAASMSSCERFGDSSAGSTFVVRSLAGTTYQQGFDGLTSGALAGQDSWTTFLSTGALIAVTSTAALMGSRYGLVLSATSGQTGEVKRVVTMATTMTVEFDLVWRRAAGNAGNSYVLLGYYNTAGTARSGAAFFYEENSWSMRLYINTGTSYTISTANYAYEYYADPVLGSTGRLKHFTMQWDRTDPANTISKIWINGLQADVRTINTTNVTQFGLGIVAGAASVIQVFIDNFRVGGDVAAASGCADYPVDRGAQARGRHGYAGYSATGYSVSSLVSGAYYAQENYNTASVALYSDATHSAFFQTFVATEHAQLDVLRVPLCINAPGSVSNLYVEIRPCVGTRPDTAGSALARSRIMYARFPHERWGTDEYNAEFVFPLPVALHTTTTYAAVLLPIYYGYTSGGAKVFLDTSGAYADGSYGFGSDGAFTVSSGTDMIFAMYSSHYSATENTASTQDQDHALLGATATAFPSQSFQVSCGTELRHVWLWMKMHNAAAIATGSAYWVELQEDDGTGKPINTILARTRPQEATQVNWTAYRWQCLSFVDAQTLTAAHTYHLVVKADYTVSATNHLDIGYDGSAAGYSGGQMCVGTEVIAGTRYIPTWTATATADLCFKVMRPSRAYVRTSLATGTDGATYGSYSPVIEGRWGAATVDGYGDMPDGNYWHTATAFTFTTSAPDRYWSYKHELISPPGCPVTPMLCGSTLTDRDNAPAYLYVDMGREGPIDRIEIYGHPDDGGIHQVQLSYAPSSGVYVTISATGYKASTLEGRKEGGGGSASYDTAAGCFHVDGQYLGFMLSSQTTVRYIRAAVYGSESGYAYIAEIRARMVQDFSSRVLSLQVKRESDMVHRRTRAATLNMSLNNSDGALHTLRTDVNSWSSQLGPGVSYLVYSEYSDASDSIRQGQFYSDGWTENGSSVQVTARDGQKLLGQQVRPTYKQGLRTDQLIEYLGNLCGVPSVDMALDITPSTVDYFAPDTIDAFEHVNLLAESAGWGREHFSEDGYMTFVATGDTARNIGAENTTVSWGGTIARLDGPPVQIGKTVYWATEKATAGVWSGYTVQYDTETRGITCAANSSWWTNTADNPGAALATYNGKVVLVTSDGFIREYPTDIDGALMTSGTYYSEPRVARHPGAGTAININDSDNYSVVDGRLYLEYLEVDLLSRAIITAGWQPVGEVGDWLVGRELIGFDSFLTRRSLAGRQIMDLLWYQTVGAAYLWVGPGSMSKANVITSDDRLLTFGIAASTSALVADANVIEARFTTTAGYGRAATCTTVCSWGNGLAEFRYVTATQAKDCQCLAWANGIISVGFGRRNPDSTTSYRWGVYDENTRIQSESDGIGAGSSGIRMMRTFSRGSQTWLMGAGGYSQFFEALVRKREAVQDAPVATLTNKDTLLALSVRGLDGSGGENTIVNQVVVKSAPLYAGDTVTCWQKESLLWPCVPGVRIQHRINLDQTCEAPQSVTVAFAGGGAGTAYINGTLGSIVHHKQPTLSIVPSAAGFVGAVTVNARKMENRGGVVSISFGPSTSINRYGLRGMNVENDYIYSTFSQGLIAASIISRYANPRVILTNVEAMAMWNLRLFDRIHVTDSESGVDDDFLVAGINTDYLTQRMQLTLIRVEAVP